MTSHWTLRSRTCTRPARGAHIKGALALGATMEEIMETLKIATAFGQEPINTAIPILAEEISAFEKKK